MTTEELGAIDTRRVLFFSREESREDDFYDNAPDDIKTLINEVKRLQAENAALNHLADVEDEYEQMCVSEGLNHVDWKSVERKLREARAAVGRRFIPEPDKITEINTEHIRVYQASDQIYLPGWTIDLKNPCAFPKEEWVELARKILNADESGLM